ncbi:MAG: DUF4040 domain-containing protein [Gloeomargarita sp. SKYG116]|nr:DUF4040 domain-containing protein [Gloeomargarita sp. SKYG116]MDW8401553.1 DUF4040 domain-containing protein [Gloeomargarita sp. SKYGB_i_bin116]
MDPTIEVIALLLPLTAGLLVAETNPYRALVIRGVFGAMSSLLYGLLGAADVALTEALVGTLLAVILYAVAVRSSLVVRLGVLQQDFQAAAPEWVTLTTALQQAFKSWHMQVEWVPYEQSQALERALAEREVHGICTRSPTAVIQAKTRVYRLYEILQQEGVVPIVMYDQPVTSSEEPR